MRTDVRALITPPEPPARPPGGGRARGQPALPEAARRRGLRLAVGSLDLVARDGGVALRVRVQPRASRDEVGGRAGRRPRRAPHRAARRGAGQRGPGPAPGQAARGPAFRGRDRCGERKPRASSLRGERSERGRGARPPRRCRVSPDERDRGRPRRPQHRSPGHAPRARRRGSARSSATSRVIRERGPGRAGRPDRLGRSRQRAATPESTWPPRSTCSTRGGAAVVPGFVDAHTHLAFAGDRDDEIRAAPGRRELQGDRGGGRRHRPVGRGHAGRVRRRRSTAASCVAPRRDAALRHDHGRGEERLRPRDRGRDPVARGHPTPRRRRIPSPSCPPSWARTRCRRSTASERGRYVDDARRAR